MKAGRALPFVGLAAGTTLIVLGTTTLSAAWIGSSMAKRERFRVGLVGATLAGLGAVLEALAGMELAEARSDELAEAA